MAEGMERPCPFLIESGNPKIPWQDWKKTFDSYLLAIGGKDFPVHRKQAILINCLGECGRRVFRTLPDVQVGMEAGNAVDVFVRTERMLETQFDDAGNTVLQRHRFFSRVQKEHECLNSYLAALRDLSSLCQFGELLDSLIKDQLVRCCVNSKVRERLLSIKALSLDKAIDIMKAVEESEKGDKEIEGHKKTDVGAIKPIEDSRANFNNRKETLGKTFGWKRDGGGASGSREAGGRRLACYRCGSFDHLAAAERCPGSWSEGTLDYFLKNNQIKTRDAAEIIWFHAANSKSELKDALASPAHMIEADVLLRRTGSGKVEPIMAHPPATDSDITLQEWLKDILKTNKGIKLDFKSLEAVKPSLLLLDEVRSSLKRPLWINADILSGPNGFAHPVDAELFLDAVLSTFTDVTLSLGWTTGWHPEKINEGYSWEMVRRIERICSGLSQPVTFPVRATLVCQSSTELFWLLQKSNRYSLTVWTGKDDKYPTEDLVFLREKLSKDKVFYDILEPQNSEFKHIIAQGQPSK